MRKESDPTQMSLPFVFNVIALLLSLYFIYVLTVILKDSCLACYAVHMVNGLLLLLNGFYLIRARDAINRKYLKSFFFNTKTAVITLLSVLLATNIVSGTNFLETKYHLNAERKKLNSNLQYYSYLHKQSKIYEFAIAPSDRVVGEKAFAGHEILLIYKDGCTHCARAKEKLSTWVREHHLAVYLVMKNIDGISKEHLRQLGITRVPVVFIDGKRADGWEIPGFMDEYLNDCGC